MQASRRAVAGADALPVTGAASTAWAEAGRAIYGRLTRRRMAVMLVLALAGAAAAVLDVAVGPSGLPVRTVLATLVDPDGASATERIIVWGLRLPATAMALIVGAALGLAGAEIQTLLRNPLASPYTLGISAGAGFGAALALSFGGLLVGGAMLNQWLVPAGAFAFAMLTCAAVYGFSRLKGVTSETMVLAGIALLFLFHALLALLQYLANEETLQAIVFWLFGSLAKATWARVAVVGAVLAASLGPLLRDSWRLTALRMGDERAHALGGDPAALRIRVYFWLSLLTAAAVCFVGTIGFIGLVAPHAARMLVGEDQRFLAPAAMLCGALMLVLAAAVSKLVVPGALFPVGVVTALIGVPAFVLLMLKSRRRFW